MKTLLKAMTVAGLLIMLAAPALAVRGPQAVEFTIHNLSANMGGTPQAPFDNQYTTNEEEICIFCHTPHGGTLDGPLWNHAVPGANSFTHYNSATLTSAAADGTRPVSSESLICLSCHDGSIATNRILNPSNNNPTGQPQNKMQGNANEVDIASGFGLPSARIGESASNVNGTGDLSDDHPISFSYFDAYTQESSQPDGGGLRLPADAITDGVQFFGAGGVAGGQMLECSSCHDPHVAYDTYFETWYGPLPGGLSADADYTPFLITPNTGSALCLACHIK